MKPQWFGPKQRGYGIGPRSWQGWLASAIFLGVIIFSRFVRFETYGLPHGFRAALVAGAGTLFLALVFLTYQQDP